MKITVGVFFGGCSVEHEVSVISGLQAFAALPDTLNALAEISEKLLGHLKTI